MNRMFCLLLAFGCGSAKPPREVMPDMTEPAWARELVANAKTGCACTDEACLNAAHDELAAMLTRHGGIDDAPPSVHTALGTFDRCWRDGTKDLGRDLEAVEAKLCACTTEDCLRLAKLEYVGLTEGKYRDEFRDLLDENVRALGANVRIAECVEKVTMPAATMTALLERTTDAMCACKDLACTQGVMADRTAGMVGYLQVDERIDMGHVNALGVRWCHCLEAAAVAEVKGASPVPALTSVSVAMDCH